MSIVDNHRRLADLEQVEPARRLFQIGGEGLQPGANASKEKPAAQPAPAVAKAFST